jgi:hypothetical protein
MSCFKPGNGMQSGSVAPEDAANHRTERKRRKQPVLTFTNKKDKESKSFVWNNCCETRRISSLPIQADKSDD